MTKKEKMEYKRQTTIKDDNLTRTKNRRNTKTAILIIKDRRNHN